MIYNVIHYCPKCNREEMGKSENKSCCGLTMCKLSVSCEGNVSKIEWKLLERMKLQGVIKPIVEAKVEVKDD